jgi:hypothetical protein
MRSNAALGERESSLVLPVAFDDVDLGMPPPRSSLLRGSSTASHAISLAAGLRG